MEDLTSKKCIPKQDVVYIWKMKNNCYICWKLFIEQKNVQHYCMVKSVWNNILLDVTVIKKFIYSH